MSAYNPKYHHRRSIRLKGYNYSQAGLYFITLCVADRLPIFGHIKNHILVLNALGKIALTEWENTALIRPNCVLHDFIIMPNHFHAIIEIKESFEKEISLERESDIDLGESQFGSNDTGELQFAPTAFKSPSQTIGAIIRGYKGATTKKIKEILYSELLKKDSGNSEIKKNSEISTGESQFALSDLDLGELQFAPTAKLNLKKSIWQRNYYEHIIKDERAYRNISNYIINNPLKWDEDKFHSK